MDNSEAADRAEDALKFMKCEVRASFYFQKMVRNMFRSFALRSGVGDLMLDRAEAAVPEDLYKIDVLSGKSGRIIASCNLREGKFSLLLASDKSLAKENSFVNAFFGLCGLKGG